jgi:undecaprenyl-diphosphatase
MTLLIPRERPAVPKPDEVPPTSSYPSGHTAAATALYVGLALLLASRVRNMWARVAIVAVGLLPPIGVAVGRVARGMHHPSDVLTGFALGLACLAGAALVVAVTTRVAERREDLS